MPQLAVLAQKVINRYGASTAELPVIQSTLVKLDEELTQHLAKEQAILFPYVVLLERASIDPRDQPKGCFNSITSPIATMTEEHEAAGALLAVLRRLSQNFTTREEACLTYHAFYDGLKDFEQDLHQHNHLENNILIPRAIDLERSAF